MAIHPSVDASGAREALDVPRDQLAAEARRAGAHLRLSLLAHSPQMGGGERGMVVTRDGIPADATGGAAASLVAAAEAAAFALEVAAVAAQDQDETCAAAVRAVTTAALAAQDALQRRGRGELLRLAEATGHAAHLAADALITESRPAQPALERGARSVARTPFPRSWRALLDHLFLECSERKQQTDIAVHDGVLGACFAALHVVRAYERAVTAGGATCRLARLTALATTYAGWGLLLEAEPRRSA